MQNNNVEQTTSENHSQQEDIVSGVAWLSFANILSRVLGAVYIIPWYAWMAPFSNEANALFSMGYNIYALFLLLSTMGINVAVAKEVAYYNALNKKELSYYLVRQLTLFMAGLGIVSAAIMFFLASPIASISGGGKALIPVIRSLSLSILIFPAMSVIRGYFQGINRMKAIAMSQICEQIIRIIWMLVATYSIMRLGSKDWQTAVTQSTTAAFIGMIASVGVLLYYLIKTETLSPLFFQKINTYDEKTNQIILNAIRTAIPFIIIGSASSIFRLIDQITFSSTMHLVTNFTHDQLLVLFSYFSANTDKITMILIAVALTLAEVGIPLITSAYTKKKSKEVAHLISFNFQFFVAFMLPAILGVVILARPIYILFYTVPDNLQRSLLIYTTLQSFIVALIALIWIFLQAMQQSRIAMIHFGISLLVKIILQIPCILLFHSFGPLIATTLAFIVAIYLSIRKLHQISHFSIKRTRKGILGITILSVLMALVVIIVNFILELIFHSSGSRFIALITILVAGGLGLSLYIFLAAKLGFLEKFLGTRGTVIRQRFHI